MLFKKDYTLHLAIDLDTYGNDVNYIIDDVEVNAMADLTEMIYNDLTAFVKENNLKRCLPTFKEEE